MYVYVHRLTFCSERTTCSSNAVESPGSPRSKRRLRRSKSFFRTLPHSKSCWCASNPSLSQWTLRPYFTTPLYKANCGVLKTESKCKWVWLCVYVYTYICIYIYVYIHTYIYIYAHVFNIYLYTHSIYIVYQFMYVLYTDLHIYVYMSVKSTCGKWCTGVYIKSSMYTCNSPTYARSPVLGAFRQPHNIPHST